MLSTLIVDNLVGQVGNLRPMGDRPVSNSGSNTRRITNPPQDAILRHIRMSKLQGRLKAGCRQDCPPHSEGIRY